MEGSKARQPVVAIVDDDRNVRTTSVRGLTHHGYKCHPFASGEDFLEGLEYLEFDCVLLDMRMPGKDGMEVLKSIPSEKRSTPIIFFTSHGDIPTAISAVKAGAIDFIEKPSTFREIAEKIDSVMKSASTMRSASEVKAHAKARVDQLSEREKEILEYVCQGNSSRDISEILSISYRTVETHRYNASKKLNVNSLAETIQLFQLLNS